jgi:hypothetical protein
MSLSKEDSAGLWKAVENGKQDNPEKDIFEQYVNIIATAS